MEHVLIKWRCSNCHHYGEVDIGTEQELSRMNSGEVYTLTTSAVSQQHTNPCGKPSITLSWKDEQIKDWTIYPDPED